MRYGVSLAIYGHIYGPASALAPVLVFLGGNPLFSMASEDGKSSLYLLFLPLYMTFALRMIQLSMFVLGNYYLKQTYFRMRAVFSVFAVMNTVLWSVVAIASQ
ncbi:hypothetical protein B0H19DRAFT_1152000 [Mycena capillaripes]|nr:hypothetical protein B0H19DRAFT_1152000 [Mycena capillaripes]